MNKNKQAMKTVGFVVIGRNEGDRLKSCLRSIMEGSKLDEAGTPERSIVYVDSGSSDGSVKFAEDFGCDVVCLNDDYPFTAARARNAGFNRLIKKNPSIKYVQFIDGDCILDKSWLSKGLTFIAGQPEIAIVCGRRRELYPEKSIYNLLCDIEWNTPIGQSNACGGDFLARREALEHVGGFCPELIAGEEPEMCFRLSENGWRVWRLDSEMTMHDAAIHKFRQFWLRSKRSGHAYAERSAMHATRKSPYCIRPVLSILFWGGVLPITIFIIGTANLIMATALLSSYAILCLKITLAKYQKYRDIRCSFYYGILTTLGKFAQFSGVLQFIGKRMYRSESTLIEYK